MDWVERAVRSREMITERHIKIVGIVIIVTVEAGYLISLRISEAFCAGSVIVGNLIHEVADLIVSAIVVKQGLAGQPPIPPDSLAADHDVVYQRRGRIPCSTD